MENKLRELLDKIYELEGLVHLSIKRTELHDDFVRLISIKGEEIYNLCKGLNNGLTEPDEVELMQDIHEIRPYALEEYQLETDNETIEEENLYTESDEENQESSNIVSEENESRGKLVFSINDKFRFRKELFGDSDVDFNNTLVLVASMENYDEAEDYFVNEQGWNTSKESVKEFLDIIKRYFK